MKSIMMENWTKLANVTSTTEPTPNMTVTAHGSIKNDNMKRISINNPHNVTDIADVDGEGGPVAAAAATVAAATATT